MSCLHCSIARHPAGSRLPRADVEASAGSARPAPRSSDIRRVWDEAMARAAGQPQLPLQRYLSVLVAST